MGYVKPPLENGCECGGYGYDVFDVNTLEGVEVQVNDSCKCLRERIQDDDESPANDRDAMAVFILDLLNFQHGRHRDFLRTRAAAYVDLWFGEGASRS